MSHGAHRATHALRLTVADIGRAATLALHDELELAPKPGLVSFIDSGSHADMDAHTFMRSLFALRHYFVQIAALGEAHAPFEALEHCGIAAEQRMLAATGGINTHRGAIFTLGLLCASAGALVREGQPLSPHALRTALRRHWGDALHTRSRRVSMLPGGVAARRYGLRSASEEAALGFPVLFDIAVPALAAATRCGLDSQRARLDTLFAIMASLDDSNLAHRGGLAGLHHARHAARGYLERGGAATDKHFEAAWAIHRDFVARRLSPGGAADTLAAACWMRRICTRLA
ncbi:triphosphoribosyl-dephospho-CoA synthase MdcB [Variovorax sp. YR216]|uniref:triphosphoribosyl-dephospho-CoA synthase MdcB n=1 Tax=Variovorax sp. YR216 TaxID=1882828 RepID=UPI001C4096FB|nr:triphosphoribosyl-dephospho-CoA synthase MdcB [Variovorax sp. YR216]